jgi:hypothetical protein
VSEVRNWRSLGWGCRHSEERCFACRSRNANARPYTPCEVRVPPTIEAGVPLPPRSAILRQRAHSPVARSLLLLDVGESFSVPLTERKRVRMIVLTWARNTGRTFETRILPTGFRVWRTR